MRPLARVAYQSAVEFMPLHSCGQPLTKKTLPSRRTSRTDCSKRAQLVEGALAPDDGGGRHEVGLDAAGAGRRDQVPVGLDAVPALRIDDVVDVTVARPSTSGPRCPSWRGRPCLMATTWSPPRLGSTTRGRCRSPTRRSGAGRRRRRRRPGSRARRLRCGRRCGPAARSAASALADEPRSRRTPRGIRTVRLRAIELHVLIAHDAAQRAGAGRVGAPAPRRGRRHSRVRRWHCRRWGRPRLPSARPRRTRRSSASKSSALTATVRPACGVHRLQLRVVAEPAAGEVDGHELGREQSFGDVRVAGVLHDDGGGGADGTERAGRQGGLEHVGGRGSPRRGARRHGGRRGAGCRGRGRRGRRTMPVLPVVPVVPESPELELVPEELLLLVTAVELDEEVEAAVPRPAPAPGWSWATTIPRATVAPPAATIAPRVRKRTRDLALSLSAGLFGWLGDMGGPRLATPLSQHARFDTDAGSAVALL